MLVHTGMVLAYIFKIVFYFQIPAWLFFLFFSNWQPEAARINSKKIFQLAGNSEIFFIRSRQIISKKIFQLAWPSPKSFFTGSRQTNYFPPISLSSLCLSWVFPLFPICFPLVFPLYSPYISFIFPLCFLCIPLYFLDHPFIFPLYFWYSLHTAFGSSFVFPLSFLNICFVLSKQKNNLKSV